MTLMLDRKRNLPLLHMAWRNTRRNTRRTLLTVSAVTVAVAALIYGLSHVNGLLDGMLDTYPNPMADFEGGADCWTR